MAKDTRVGFIGLGQMGLHMARNVLKAGFPLVVHNRSRVKVEQLVSEGASAATSGAHLAAQVDIVLSCVPMPSDVRTVYFGENGVLAAARQGTILCDMSTVDAETHREIAAAAAAKGAGYLDAPVSGGPSGALNATLAIMVGGDQATFDRARPVFEAMGKNIYLIGPVGAGANVKLINQMMGAICNLGVMEGLVMGMKAGIDPALLVEIVTNSSGFSAALRGAAPAIMERNFEPGFTLDLMHKDVALAVELAKQLNVRVLAGSMAEQVIQEARGSGLGSRGMAALVQPLEKISGVVVQK